MQLVRPPHAAPSRYNVPLFVRLGDVPIGRTRNLSMNGVFVETAVRPQVGLVQELYVVWDNTTYMCPVTIVRHDAEGLGLAFQNPDASFLQAIGDILKESTTPPPILTPAK